MGIQLFSELYSIIRVTPSAPLCAGPFFGLPDDRTLTLCSYYLDDFLTILRPKGLEFYRKNSEIW